MRNYARLYLLSSLYPSDCGDNLFGCFHCWVGSLNSRWVSFLRVPQPSYSSRLTCKFRVYKWAHWPQPWLRPWVPSMDKLERLVWLNFLIYWHWNSVASLGRPYLGHPLHEMRWCVQLIQWCRDEWKEICSCPSAATMVPVQWPSHDF